MKTDSIIIKNAHTNNLKHVDVELPKHSIVVFTGVSGSGKSSLLFDTIYTEAQRQLIETFSSFARARLPKLSRPDVDEIKYLSTPIVIDQKKMGNNLRSTVGTATELATYIRLLYSRVGQPMLHLPSFAFSFNHPEGMCPHCQGLGKEVKIDIDLFLDKEKSLREGALLHPNYKQNSYLLKELLKYGIFDNDKPLKDWSEEELHKLLYSEPIDLDKSKTGLSYNRYHEGIITKLERSIIEKAIDQKDEDEQNARDKFFTYRVCEHCHGSRINNRARSVKIGGKSIDQIFSMELSDVWEFFKQMETNTDHDEAREMALPILRKVNYILSQLVNIGVGYLSLDRPVSTLSGGESQRVKMARQLDCDLTDLIYVLDEPSIGLHTWDDAVKTRCPECEGKRYNKKALGYLYRGQNIAEVLDMTVEEALSFFADEKKVTRYLLLLQEVGLSYLKLGQTLSSLSGGESQRLKIATELRKKGNIYVMDEPTTGLHMNDIERFYQIVCQLVDAGNTVVIIEHNLDIIRRADWIIDLGPEGGKNGGDVLFEGTPEDLRFCPRSITARYI